MSWKPEVDGIEQRRRLAAEHGGAEAVAKQHELGRLAIRERIFASLYFTERVLSPIAKTQPVPPT